MAGNPYVSSCHAVILYHYCLDARQVGHVWAGTYRALFAAVKCYRSQTPEAAFKSNLPGKKPEWKKLAAVLLYWISSYALVIPLTMLVAYFFPEQMFSVSEHMNTFMASVSPFLAVLITSVMPAVCEEAMHRGFILKCFQSRIKNIWILTILMGILFGLFHGSIWRFLPTALLGGVLSYLMIRTENMIYPAFFHFINNFLPSFLANLAVGISGNAQTDTAGQQLMEQGLPLSFLGIYFAMRVLFLLDFILLITFLEKESKEENSIVTYRRIKCLWHLSF